MERREAALARRGTRIRACLEEVTHDLSPLEECREPKRREPVLRNGVRLPALLCDDLAHARRIAGGRSLEHVQRRSAGEYRRRDVAFAVVERHQGGREAVLVARVHESAVALQEALHYRPVATF